jgi:hypothetical protein
MYKHIPTTFMLLSLMFSVTAFADAYCPASVTMSCVKSAMGAGVDCSLAQPLQGWKYSYTQPVAMPPSVGLHTVALYQVTYLQSLQEGLICRYLDTAHFDTSGSRLASQTLQPDTAGSSSTNLWRGNPGQNYLCGTTNDLNSQSCPLKDK